MSGPLSFDAFRERFQEADDRFQNGMLEALRGHQQCVNIFMQMFAVAATRISALETTVAELRETVSELKVLVLAQGAEIRALKERLIDPQ